MRPPLRPPDDDLASAAPPSPDAVTGDASSPAATVPPTDLLGILDPILQVDTVDNPFALHPMELLFVEAYCGVANFRAAKAYEIAGYKTTGAAARANASRMLTKERIAAAIAARLGARVKALRIMDGDEALEGISTLARSDIRKVFPPNSWVAKLPDEVAATIKTIRPGKHGYTIELYPKDHALEVMAKVAGRLKDVVKVEHTLEDILARANGSDSGEAA